MQVSLLGLMCGFHCYYFIMEMLTCIILLGVDFSATYAFCPAKPYFLVLFWGKIFFCVPFNACAAWPPGQSKKLEEKSS